MNSQNKIFLVWIALNFFGGHFSASAQKTPADLQLNGIAAIFGDRVALFTLSPSENFSLTEGESHSGIKLLAIDFPSRCVRIDDHGTVRSIRICGTPELTGASQARVPETEMNSNGTLKISSESGFNAASPSFQTNADGVVTYVGGGSVNASADKTPGSTGNGSAADENPPVYQWWMKEAQKIENARTATADRVMAGQWPPYPLTPLTPSGTPAQLISGDSVFMDHGPGIVLSGN